MNHLTYGRLAIATTGPAVAEPLGSGKTSTTLTWSDSCRSCIAWGACSAYFGSGPELGQPAVLALFSIAVPAVRPTADWHGSLGSSCS